MATDNLNEQLAERMEAHLSGIENFAEQVEEAQWGLACSVVHTEEERSAVMEAPKSVKYTLTRKGSKFSLSRKELDETIIIGLIENGKETPYTKGPGGEVQQLDGSTEPSRSRVAGVPLPWFAWDAVPIEEDAYKILKDTIPSQFSDAAKQEAPEVVKPFAINRIRGALQC